METLLPFLIGAAALATLVVLAYGVVNFFRKDHSPRRSNKLMQWRVLLQAIAIGLLLLFMWVAGK